MANGFPLTFPEGSLTCEKKLSKLKVHCQEPAAFTLQEYAFEVR